MGGQQSADAGTHSSEEGSTHCHTCAPADERGFLIAGCSNRNSECGADSKANECVPAMMSGAPETDVLHILFLNQLIFPQLNRIVRDGLDFANVRLAVGGFDLHSLAGN